MGISNKTTDSGIPIPFPFVDVGKAWSVLSDPTLFKGPEVSAKEGRAIVAEYKRQYKDYKKKGGTRSYGSWIKWKGYGKGLNGGNIGRDAVKGIQSIAKKGVSRIPIVGSIVDPIMNLLKRSDEQKLREWAFQDQIAKRYLTPSQYKQYKAQDKRTLGNGIDVHKLIGKLPRPQKGFTIPGHHYTGPFNPLEKQLRHDPNTGEILEIYQQRTGKTDAVSMQHDGDYSVCGNKPKNDQLKCKNDADRKMVKALDAIPWKERQWGHVIARNAIAAKSKLGMGVKKPKNVKSRRVKKTGKKN